MDRSEIKEFVREVFGAEVDTADMPEWVSLHCVLAPWTHRSGKDSRPSAGISIKPGAASIYHCLACHKKGPLSWLLRQVERYTGEEWGALADSIEAGEFLGGTLPQWGEVPEQAQSPEPIDRDLYFDLYDSAAGHPYLAARGVTDEAALRMELLHDPGDGGDERILFPVYDTERRLFGFSGRAVQPTAKLRIKDYYGLPKRNLLLGAHLVGASEYVILVEGLFDYARMVTYGQPAMAFMSSTLTPAQAQIVKDIGKPVYFFHDNDEPGEDARERAKRLLWRYVPMMKVRYPAECTIGTPEGGLRPPEDPGELTEAQVRRMLKEARLL